MGELVYFLRDGQGWAGPHTVVRLENGVVDIFHDGTVITADFHRVWHAPTFRLPDGEVSETYKEPENIQRSSTNNKENEAKFLSKRSQEEDDKRPTHKQNEVDGVTNTASSSKSCRTSRTHAKLLAEESKAIIGSLPEKMVSHPPSHPPSQKHIIRIDNTPPSNMSNKLSAEEKRAAHGM